MRVLANLASDHDNFVGISSALGDDLLVSLVNFVRADLF